MTYIQQAVDIINALGQYDFDEYSQLVYFVLKNKLRSKNRIIFLAKLLECKVSSDQIIAYKTSLDMIYPSQIQEGDIFFTSSVSDDKVIVDLSSETDIGGNFALLCLRAAEKVTKIEEGDQISGIEDIRILNGEGRPLSTMTQLVSLCVEICQKEYSKFLSTFSTYKATVIYTFLIKSTLVGEFLSLDDFSNRLRSILQKGLNSPKDEAKEDRIVPPIINIVENIIHEYTKFCNLKSLLYKCNNEVGIVPYYYDLEEKEAIYKLIGIDTFLIKLHILFQYSLKIAAIDLCYYATENNLQILIDALFHNYRIKQILQNQDVRQDINLLRTTNLYLYNLFQEVLIEIEFKASALANGILDAKKWEKEISVYGHNYVIAGYNEIKHILRQNRYYQPSKIINPVTEFYHQENKNEWYFKYVNKQPCRYEFEHKNDVKSYDSQVKSTHKTYFEEQELIYKADCASEDEISLIIDNLEIRSQKYIKNITPTFFTTLIPLIYKKIHKDNLAESLYNKWIHAYRILLRILRNYIQTYKDQYDVPLQFRPFFYNSFYLHTEENSWIHVDNYHDLEQTEFTIIQNNSDAVFEKENNTIENKVISDRNKSIFFASYQYEPIDMEYLENFFYEYNNKWHEIQEKRITEQIDKISLLSEQNVETRKSVCDSLVDERKKTVQLLGIFGAMLAFVSSVVGMQKVVESPYEFAIFASIYILGLLIFVFAISCISKIGSQNKSSKQKNKSGVGKNNM